MDPVASRKSPEASARRDPSSRAGDPLTLYLPQVAVATLFVAVLPVVAVWLLRSDGVIGSWACLVLAMGLSTVLSWVGCAYWKRSEGSGDLLFSELLVWGWLRRWRAEGRLASAVELLGVLQSDPRRLAGGSVDRREEVLRAVAAALEAEDRYTRGHSHRVARYAASIARKMGLSDVEVEAVCAAALVHDVGKLRIPAEVLNKPTRLTNAEFELIKRHPVDGADMVASLGNDQLTSLVRHHHERMDGNGYPDGLSGEQIPLGARIIAVADTFDAITSVRPYRPRRAHKQALDILASEQGLQLDRDAVRAFLHCYSGRRTMALWAVTVSVVQRAVSWMTGEATAATITTGHVVVTAVATVAIGAVAMTPSVVARIAPIATAANRAAAGRSDHVHSGHGLSVAAAGGPTGLSPLPRAPFDSHGPKLSVSPTSGVGRRLGHPVAVAPGGASRRHYRHGDGGSHARHRFARGHSEEPGASRLDLLRRTSAKPTRRADRGSNSVIAASGAPAGARPMGAGGGNSSGSTANSGKGRQSPGRTRAPRSNGVALSAPAPARPPIAGKKAPQALAANPAKGMNPKAHQ